MAKVIEGQITKNLANCKPSEFMKQTNRIRKSVERWLTVTEIGEIRKRLPEYEVVPEGASEDEKERIFKANKEKQNEQARKNLSAMLDAIMEEHPDETLEILALVCFIEPEHVDDYPITEYLSAINDILNNEKVLSFFTSLANVARRSGLSL